MPLPENPLSEHAPRPWQILYGRMLDLMEGATSMAFDTTGNTRTRDLGEFIVKRTTSPELSGIVYSIHQGASLFLIGRHGTMWNTVGNFDARDFDGMFNGIVAALEEAKSLWRTQQLDPIARRNFPEVPDYMPEDL